MPIFYNLGIKHETYEEIGERLAQIEARCRQVFDIFGGEPGSGNPDRARSCRKLPFRAIFWFNNLSVYAGLALKYIKILREFFRSIGEPSLSLSLDQSEQTTLLQFGINCYNVYSNRNNKKIIKKNVIIVFIG